MPIKEQLKTGKSITVVQLIISVTVVLGSAVGLYVKNAVAMSEMNGRLNVVERYQAKQDEKATSRSEARNAEIKALDQRIQGNSNDINILKIQKQDKK